MSRSTGLESYSRTAGITNTGLEAPSPGALNPSPEAPKADLQVARLRCIHISSVASFGDLSPGTGHPALHCLPAWLPAQEHRRDETVRGGGWQFTHLLVYPGSQLQSNRKKAPTANINARSETKHKHRRILQKYLYLSSTRCRIPYCYSTTDLQADHSKYIKYII